MFTHKSDELIGKVVGDYKIDRLIAKGGMGRVYEATDRQLNRRVAIKVITLDEDRASELMSRFRREALAISKLDNHPNIVNIYRYGEQDGLHYLAMQLISGQSLAERYQELKDRDRLIEPEELLHIFRQIAAALDHAHKHDVIHRDVKPANIMLEPTSDNPDGPRKAILMDFGLVMQADTTSTLGSAFGTPRYIAPEQAISSQQACAQSDIYSMGVIIYELLAGRPPFDEDETPMSIALSHITKTPPPLERFRPDLPQAVSEVVMRSMEKKPENRYQTATAFINDLAAAFEGFMPVPVPGQAPSKKASGRSRDFTRPLGGVSGALRTSRLAMVGGVVVIAIFVGLLIFLMGGEDNNGGGDGEQQGNNNTSVAVNNDETEESEDDPTNTPARTQAITAAGRNIEGLAFYYTPDHLTLVNEGGNPLDLSEIELRRGDRIFNFNDLRESELPPRSCTYITTSGNPRPAICPSDEQSIPELTYSQANNFVWVNRDSNATFDIYYDGDLVTTCTVGDEACIINDAQ